MRTCTIEGCNNQHFAKGYCKKHYQRWYRYGDTSFYKYERHGKKNIPEYGIWCHMKNRCYDANNVYYKHYGGRGIFVCERWKKSFTAFLKDMGERPFPKAQIDRIDNEGNYEPSNCRWTTAKINRRNSRQTKLTEEIANQIRKEYIPGIVHQQALAEKYGVGQTTISYIIRKKIWA